MSVPKPKLDSLPPTLRRRFANVSEDEWRQMKENLKECHRLPALSELLSNPPEVVEGRKLAERLILGAWDLLTGERYRESLNPVEVGLFLGTLLNCEPDDLKWKVLHGLKRLGIKRRSRRGRPPGKKSEIEQVIQFRIYQWLIETKQIWEKKQEAIKKFPKDWHSRLRKDLRANGWSPDEIDRVISSKTARSLAIAMTADKRNVGYDTVQRSIRRHPRP